MKTALLAILPILKPLKMGFEQDAEEGFRAWRRNHVLAAPFLFSMLVNLLLFAMAFAAILLLTRLNIWLGLLAAIPFFTLFFIARYLVSARFFTSAVNMAEKALSGGRLDFSDAFQADNHTALKVAASDIIWGLTAFASLAGFGMLKFILGIDFTALSAFLIGCASLFTPFFIVLSSRGPVEAVGDGINYLQTKPLTVTLLFIIRSFASTFTGTFVWAVLLLCAAPLPVLAADMISGLNPFNPRIIVFIALPLILLMFLASLSSALIVSPLFTLWAVRIHSGGEAGK